MVDEARDPTLEDLLDAHGEVLLDNVHVMLPGQIVSYDADKQLAAVQPLVKHRHLDEDGETVLVRNMPVVHNCPVEFCGTARGRITWPVFAGDTCEIRFASASIQRWIQVGGLVDPGEDRRHDPTDGICFVGLHDAAHVPTDAPTDAVVIHTSGSVRIKLGSSSASESSVLGDAQHAATDTLIDAWRTFTVGLDALIVAMSTDLALLGVAPNTYTAAGVLQPLFVPFFAALGAFQAAATGYLSQKVKVE